ncbi:MAG: TetR/AcrR family transcriptional regulator [Hahellaceae bacterium]|nr:TetR/AcrR family transcriptional regulator [Hahellaceae bacterium]
MKLPNDTRTNILDVAQDLVQRQSISGVSFQDLAKRIGIKKGSMYYHFETKDELSVALVDRVANQLQESFVLGESKPARRRLDYFLAIYLKHIEVGAQLCTGGAFVGEWGGLTSPVQAAVKRLFTIQLRGLTAIIEAGSTTGELNLKGREPDTLAHWVLATVQGGLLISRVMGDTQPLRDSVAMVKAYFEIDPDPGAQHPLKT